MTEVIDTITADAIQDGDLIEYVGKRGERRTLTVKGDPDDTIDKIIVKGYSHETGDNITVEFYPDDYVDLLGA